MQLRSLTDEALAPYGGVLTIPTVNGRHGSGGATRSDWRSGHGASRGVPGRFRPGITDRADVWHHPMAVLDAPARLAVLIWRDGSADDEQFVDVQPFTLELD